MPEAPPHAPDAPDALVGLRAVVTGSSRGLGAAVARDLVNRGAHVIVNGTDADRAGAIGRDLRAPVVVGSVADEAVAERLIETCVSEFGGLDLLVNNAGIVRDAVLSRAQADDFDAVIAVHLRGTWLTSRAAARAMLGSGGAIVNVVSGTALYGNVGQSAYAAAKGGILGLTRALALELRRHGISVNAIAPVTRTEMVEPLLEHAAELAPSFGQPEDVAPIVALLASPAARELTGLVVGFDGRQLTMWSHPQAHPPITIDGAAGLGGLTAALSGAPRLTPNPDAFGHAVHRVLGVSW
jgi:3-oxoacyl-[acyl-carrier protein] reductase